MDDHADSSDAAGCAGAVFAAPRTRVVFRFEHMFFIVGDGRGPTVDRCLLLRAGGTVYEMIVGASDVFQA